MQENQPTESQGNQGHPPGLFLLFVVEMWERFSYYGMRVLLVLYLIRAMADENPGRGWAEGDANYLYGWYTGLVYLTPIVGGYLADKLLGTHRSMLVGGLLIALGHVVLGVTGLERLHTSAVGMSTFVGGLALIVLGTGFFKPCVSVMVSQLYPKGHGERKDAAFTIFYMGINLGAFICPFICGTLGEKFGWHWGFGAAAVGMIAGLVTYLVGRPRWLHDIGLPPPGASLRWPSLLFVLSVLAAAGFAMAYHYFNLSKIDAVLAYSKTLGGITFSMAWFLPLVVLAVATWFVLIQEPGDKGAVTSIFIFMLFNAFFWTAFEQAGSTLNVFTERSTNRLLFGWEVPTSWMQSINAGEILLLAPLFAALWTALGRRNLNPSQPVKIGLGLLFLGSGFVLMVFAGMLNAGGISKEQPYGLKVSMLWLLGTYTCHTIGELCLSPTGLSFVTKAAPARFVSLLMGIWFISSFLAGYVGGKIGSYVGDIETGKIPMPWHLGGRADFFMIFVVSSLGAGVLILILTPLLKRLIPPAAR